MKTLRRFQYWANKNFLIKKTRILVHIIVAWYLNDIGHINFLSLYITPFNLSYPIIYSHIIFYHIQSFNKFSHHIYHIIIHISCMMSFQIMYQVKLDHRIIISYDAIMPYIISFINRTSGNIVSDFGSVTLVSAKRKCFIVKVDSQYLLHFRYFF